MYVKDLKKKFLVIKNGGISRWTLIAGVYKRQFRYNLCLDVQFCRNNKCLSVQTVHFVAPSPPKSLTGVDKLPSLRRGGLSLS